VNERIKDYRDQDPDGRKKKMLRESVLKYQYKKHPTPLRAITLYASHYDVNPKDISIPVAQVVNEVEVICGMGTKNNGTNQS
jgi:hypothetical protein